MGAPTARGADDVTHHFEAENSSFYDPSKQFGGQIRQRSHCSQCVRYRWEIARDRGITEWADGSVCLSARPMALIIGLSPNVETLRRFSLFWGVILITSNRS